MTWRFPLGLTVAALLFLQGLFDWYITDKIIHGEAAWHIVTNRPPSPTLEELQKCIKTGCVTFTPSSSVEDQIRENVTNNIAPMISVNQDIRVHALAAKDEQGNDVIIQTTAQGYVICAPK